MKTKRKFMLVLLLFTVILGTAGDSLNVRAAEEATVTFGSDEYDQKDGDTFPVGVYLKAEEAIGDYHIEIKYDHLRLEYVSGADAADEESGVLTLTGNQNGKRLKFWIQFKAISGGEASIEVISAEAVLRDSEETESFTITTYGSAPVHIDGEDTAAAARAQLEEEARQAEAARRAEEAERETERELQAEGEGGSGSQAEGGTSGDRERSVDGEADKEPQDEAETKKEQAAGKEDGEIDNGRGTTGNVKKEKKNFIFFNVYFVFVLGTFLLIVIVDIIAWSIIKRVRAKQKTKGKKERKREEKREKKETKKEKKKRKKSSASPKGEGNRKKDIIDLNLIDLDVTNLDDADFDIVDSETDEGMATEDDLHAWMDNEHANEITLTSEEELEWQLGRPVIKICDVTMEFKLYSVNPSGIKEYAVQLLKREVSYRRLYALYHVSFNVFQGEVIGVIGTNGSGKSTLLKIVAGALKPTEGHVEITGHRKVQLLTIGTGFDMELTARENVFLNGSIIGYSKNFLETHYDEIVEFAELQDFMEEKVKNFSSGMVSRLGFAIATAGKAAEILILDEILSVGDEFFRKKSLKRIKEMIHGGSTVLMVSHSMGTILENCSRCVWIEKGILKMVGEPKVVCGEYRRMNGE